jgi:hypothetical protein
MSVTNSLVRNQEVLRAAMRPSQLVLPPVLPNSYWTFAAEGPMIGRHSKRPGAAGTAPARHRRVSSHADSI